MNKQISKAFGKTVYLLGRYKDGDVFWLEEPTWVYGWYWSAGYLKTYTHKDPTRAKGISGYTQFNMLCLRKPEIYDNLRQALVLSPNYVHLIGGHPDVAECVLTENEQWKLSELMKTIYTLKETAEVFGRGGSHIAWNPAAITLTKPDYVTVINEHLLPVLFLEAAKLLTPAKEDQWHRQTDFSSEHAAR